MALVSPGVQVTVTDESFFVPAAAPTVPLLFIASGAEKTQPDGVTPAAGTFEDNVVRTVTSLNQSVELYGEPAFLTDDNGNQLHGDARNEYGLFALNQYLGIGNRAFVVRADVNLDDDINNIRDIWDSKFTDAATLLTTLVTDFINEYNQTNGLVSTDPLFKTSVTEAEFLSLASEATAEIWNFSSFANSEDNYFDDHTIPGAATSGSQAVSYGGRLVQSQQVVNFNGYINAPQQVVTLTGSPISVAPSGSPAGVGSPGVNYGFRVIIDGGVGSPLGTQEISVSSDDTADAPTLVAAINAQLSGAFASVTTDGNILFTRLSTGASASISILDGTVGSPPNNLWAAIGATIETATVGGGNYTGLADDSTTYDFSVNFGTGASPLVQTVEVQGQNAQTFTELVTQINGQVAGGTVSINSDGDLAFVSNLQDVSNTTAVVQGPIVGGNTDLFSSLTIALGAGSPNTLSAPTIDTATNGLTHPTGLDNDATVYAASFVVDGTPRTVQVTGSAAQTFQTLINEINTDLGNTGSPLAGGVALIDIVTDTTDSNNGNLVVTSTSTGTSSTVVISDGSPSLFGTTNWFVSFLTPTAGTGADASLAVYANGYDQAATGTYDGLEGIAALWVSNSLGTVAGEWTADEASDTILAASDDYKFTVEFRSETSLGANDAARRATIVTALQSSINSSTEARSPAFEFNLILCPGYHETVDELVALSVDVEQEAFVIGDTPMNQTPSEVVAWAATSARVSSVSVAYYYPHSLASNLDGANVLGAASGTALRTYAFSDNQSELWFAPAGTRRGLVSGVTQVGYVDSAGTFVETNLNNGQRDDLYKYFTNINPIVFFPGRGIVVWGQKTSSPDASARDRVNVERLIAFVRRQLRKSLLSFVFEPNDALTRDNVKAAVDNFLGDLVVRRGLFDYATICDESNNTPDRIDRNELWVDVALQPVKAAEFIFVPIRIVATGTEI
jgi:hypothetical protein